MSATGSLRLVNLAALGVFVLAPLVGVVLTVAAVVRTGETEAVIARQEQLLAQLDARIARVAGDERRPSDTSAIYLSAASAPLAGAVLQERLVAAVEAAGGRVIETTSVEELEPDGEDDVRLRITLDVTNAGLLRLMHDLETGLPLTTLESVAVRQLPLQGDGRADDPTLRVDLGVRGFWRAAT